MILEINMTSPIPIYQQLYDQMVLGIAKGELALGEQLPTVRQLAEDIGINTMTVSKAYNLLKEDGYIQTDRRSGSQVCPVIHPKPDFLKNYQEELQTSLAKGFVNGLDKKAMQQMIEQILTDFQLAKEEKQ